MLLRPGCVDNPSEIAPSTQGTLRDHEPASETPSPDSHVEEAGAPELPTQYLLPGLEPDDASGPNHTRKRQTRSRRVRMSSNNGALRAAQMELWLDTLPTPHVRDVASLASESGRLSQTELPSLLPIYYPAL